MTALERSELQASPLADLHAIADQLGIDGFRRLRKEALIEMILETSGGGASPQENEDEAEQPASSTRRRRTGRSRRSKAAETSQPAAGDEQPAEPQVSAAETEEERVADGVVELLGNGSAFLRVSPPEPSDDDVYISATQVRRCELVSGDRVSGPVRRPRRSERYPSLVRIDKINDVSAEAVAQGPRYDDLAVAYPSERFTLDPEDPTLKAIEWLTPIGRGSRAVIVGGFGAGKTETLRRVAGALAGNANLEVSLVLVGVRPEEITAWQEGAIAPSAALTFAASADTQGHAVERAIETAKRLAARNGHTVVLIDTLDGLEPRTARRVLAAARNLANGGSLTVIATASKPYGGETTVIALDAALASSGHLPALDLAASGTLKPELLVGEDGAKAIVQARAATAE